MQNSKYYPKSRKIKLLFYSVIYKITCDEKEIKTEKKIKTKKREI